MLLSHDHKFLFLKPHKTGGTSVEVLLSNFMGKDDIVTPINLTDELERLKYNSRPRNFLALQPMPAITAQMLKQCNCDEKQFYALLQSHARIYPRFNEHMRARELKDAIPPIIWDNYLKISMTRHPYEVVVSSAWFYPLGNKVIRGETVTTSDISAAIDSIIDKPWTYNFPIFSIDDKVAVDFMIRHDHLEEDIHTLLGRLGLPANAEIPRFKSHFRQDKRPAHEILTTEQKAKIRAINYREFEIFGYKE